MFSYRQIIGVVAFLFGMPSAWAVFGFQNAFVNLFSGPRLLRLMPCCRSILDKNNKWQPTKASSNASYSKQQQDLEHEINELDFQATSSCDQFKGLVRIEQSPNSKRRSDWFAYFPGVSNQWIAYARYVGTQCDARLCDRERIMRISDEQRNSKTEVSKKRKRL